LDKYFSKITTKINESKISKSTLDWSKAIVLPGTGGMSFYSILNFINEEVQKDSITTRANSIAFSLFLSIFPFIIFLFTLLPYLPFTEDYTNTISENTVRVLPSNVHNYLMNVIKDLTQIKRGGLLSLGFILALYFSSNGILSLMRGFDKSYKEHFKKRSVIYKRGIALLLTVLLGIIFIGSIFLFLAGQEFFSKVDEVVHNDKNSDAIFHFFISTIKIILGLSVLFIGINTLYYFGPSFRKKPPFVNPGSILASALVLITSILFAFFINNFGRFNEIYGSIGALIVTLLWFKINAFILLMGFELNAAITMFRKT
jgi:membrane protein